ncbi:MAG: NADH-quinone oxidoreductase subunit NuoE [Pseudomonadota bacterium]|nr:NADH-quinone oxidoreductase subunit NuoE [Pseudomonadota bacterium]
MLSDQEKAEIEHELGQYESKQAAGIEALMILQNHRGWISDESLADLAAFLEISADELDAVATFYNHIFRRPVGRHVILICDSISCWVMGYERLLASIEERLGIKLGETTKDNRFTLLTNPCLGVCDRAPCLMIDSDLHADLDSDQAPDKLNRILGQYT